jgi:acetyl-CoA carboxylase carboxyl transferase subunit beta
MGYFHQIKNPKIKNVRRKTSNVNSDGNLWKKCPDCGEILQTEKLENNLNVCPYCHYHFRINGHTRLSYLLDKESFVEVGTDWTSLDPLAFNDKLPYKDKLEKSYENTGLKDSTILGHGKINSIPVAISIMDFQFMGGSMGIVTGEKIAQTMDLAIEMNTAAIVISCSGGARMQEGILSLMQMAKTSGCRLKLREKGLPYISILTDPTTGGVAASFALLGDINIAEPKALIGFAGPRVIEQTIRQKLPEGFQRSEFLLEHGFLDNIVSRINMKDELTFYLKMFLNSK